MANAPETTLPFWYDGDKVMSDARFPRACEVVKDLVERKVITLEAFKRPHRLSVQAIQNLNDGVLTARDFVWLMRARAAEFQRADYNAKMREEGRALS